MPFMFFMVRAFVDNQRMRRAFITLAIAAGGLVLAQAKPDFSGIWVAVTGPNAGAPGAELHIKQTAQTITIGHPEGDHGPSHNPVYKLDGVEAKQPNLAHPQETDITKASWDGNRLVIVVRPERGGSEHKRVLSLQPDGMLALELTMTVAGRSEETIKATFRKK